MKILLIGRGKMGRLIQETAAAAGDEVVAALGRNGLDSLGRMGRTADVVMDFSRPEALPEICAYVRRTGTPLLSGTTGFTPAQMVQVEALGAYAPVLWAANFSLGMAVFVRALREVCGVLKPDFDIEIIEKHHNQKMDAPSGTALALADSMNEAMDGAYEYVYDRSKERKKRDKKEMGISAVRGGTIVGDHEVIFAGADEVIEFKHTAYSKAVFGKGAVEAAKFLAGKPAGIYDMSDVIQF